MSYKYSKGSQVIGDLKAADDAERNTVIDFGEDRIDLQTSGSTRIKISGAYGAVTFNESFTFPTSAGSNGQILKTDGSGNLSWQNESGGLTAVQTLNSLTGATGDVEHSCTNSNFFYHTNISGNFTPNFTQLNMQNDKITDAGLILTQGGTGFLPTAFKVDNTGSAIYWEGTAMPTASTNGTDTIDLKITRVSNNYNVFARFSTTVYVAAPSGGGGFSIPTGAMLYLDASDANSYGGSGGTWTDLSGQGNDATQQGTPVFDSTDKLFDMNSGDFFTLPSGFADFTGGATFFFIADFGTSNNWERILDFSVGGQTDHAFNIGRQGSSTNVALQYYKVVEDNSSQAFNTNQIENDTLIFFCLTTDGTNAKAYKNGSLAETVSFPYTLSNTTRTQNYIARSRANTSQDLRGKLAVVGIWGRTLSASEITDLFNHYDTIYSL